MLTILAHRGNITGPSPVAENRRPTIRAALARGFGLEIDIRRAADGRFYLSHDPATAVDDLIADGTLGLVAGHPRATVALNIKETGYEAELLAYLGRQGVLDQTFLFDMELIEPEPGVTARRFRQLNRAVRLAARVSDRAEPVERALAQDTASVIWLDEFDGPWCTEHDVRALKSSGRTVYAVSPDLHHGSLDDARARWAQFLAWGVDGICTDFPEELERTAADVSRGGAR